MYIAGLSLYQLICVRVVPAEPRLHAVRAVNEFFVFVSSEVN